jgi:hypothetical protein
MFCAKYEYYNMLSTESSSRINLNVHGRYSLNFYEVIRLLSSLPTVYIRDIFKIYWRGDGGKMFGGSVVKSGSFLSEPICYFHIQ